MSAMSMQRRPFEITGRKVLFGLFAFFGVIFAVNGAFLYFAMESWPGLTTDKAYVEGLEYNQVLEAAERQAAAGWHSNVEIIAGEGGSTVRLTMTDAAGTAIASLQPQLTVTRPVGQPDPMVVAAHEVAPGVYETMMPVLGAGRWAVAVQIGDAYHLNHDVWVKP